MLSLIKGVNMITLTIFAFVFLIDVIAIVITIAAESFMLFPIIDLLIAVLIVVFIVKALTNKK